MIAVLPQTQAESRSYLDTLGVQVHQIFQSSLESVDATGTPTLLIVDSKGQIRKAWVGKLEPDRESQVTAGLR